MIDLAREMRLARAAKSWSQLELGKKAKVSSRTIFETEASRREELKPEIVVRLAHVLDRDPQVWLKMAGHKEMPRDQIQAIVRPLSSFQFMGEVDPADFFEKLKGELATRAWITVCAAYPCAPGSMHRLDVQRYLVELLNSGKVWMAMACPYPKVKEIGKSEKPHLAAFYRGVNDEVMRLAKELQSRLEPKFHDHLAVFIPRSEDGDYLVSASPGMSEYRTAVIEHGGLECTYELVNWVTLVPDNRDRILRVYPAERVEYESSGLNTMLRWKDYFSDILRALAGARAKGWKSVDQGQLGPWRKVM